MSANASIALGPGADTPIPGHTDVRLLRASVCTRTYEARTCGGPVLVKVLDILDDDTQAQVEHEFEILRELEIDRLANALSLARIGDRLVLSYERARGPSLARIGGEYGLTVEIVLSVALQVTQTLAQLHASHVQHRNINPSTITYSQRRGEVCLQGCGISVLLDAERRDPNTPHVLHDALPYVSPEETGRTDGTVDARSDLYALGATLYELLTGRPPFDGGSAIELIYAHLARRPESPLVRRPDTPAPLAQIVLKLLEKAPERRYQTARGLAADLERVLHQLDSGGAIAPFELGTDDGSSHLRRSNAIHGREDELELLISQFDLARTQRRARMVLITGPPGIGKSMLSQQLDRPVIAGGGRVGRGRHEADDEGPHAGWVRALDSIVDQLLTESTEELDEWARRFRADLGHLVGTACQLFHRLGLLLGAPATAELADPHEAGNRLQLVVTRLLGVLSRSGPVVLVLHNLQWAGRESVALLRAVLTSPSCGGVLIVGTRHRLTHRAAHSPQPRSSLELDELGEQLDSGALLGRCIELGPLRADPLVGLVAEILQRPTAEVQPLATLIGWRTGHHPLLTRQFVEHLVDTGVISFCDGRWCWDLDEVAAATASDHVDGILEVRVAELDERARSVLRHAACIGSRFRLAELRAATQRSIPELLQNLAILGAAGFVLALGSEYCFAHEQIRELAASEIDSDERSQIHWRVGRQLLGRLDDESSLPFATVDHLDAGLRVQTRVSRLERMQLVDLNFDAGRRALAAASPEAALRYLNVARLLVHPELAEVAARSSDSPRYPMVFEVIFAWAQALASSEQHEASDRAFAELLGWSLPTADFGRVVLRWIQLLARRGANADALGRGLDSLRRCGYAIQTSPRPLAVAWNLIGIWRIVRGRTDAQLIAGPGSPEPHADAAMDILAPLTVLARRVAPRLFVTLTTLHLRLLVERGPHDTAPVALAHGAMLLAGGLRQSEQAIRLGECVDQLARRGRRVAHAEVICADHVWPLAWPFSSLAERLDTACHASLEDGELELASHLGCSAIAMRYESGTHLRSQLAATHRLQGQLGVSTAVTRVQLRVVASLAAALVDEPELDQPAASGESEGVGFWACMAGVTRALLDLIMARYDTAFAICEGMDHAGPAVDSWFGARLALVHGVSAAATSVGAERSTRRRLRGVLDRQIDRLAWWSSTCPDNFAHMHELLLAERAALRGRARVAVEHYERARSNARARRCLYVDGLASERLAALFTRLGADCLASAALRDAWDSYHRWGARTKLGQLALDEGIPTEIEERGSAAISGVMALPVQAPAESSIDLDTVTDTLTTISEELEFEILAGKILESAMVNAGADHGALLVAGEEGLEVAAFSFAPGSVRSLETPLPLDSFASMLPSSLVNYVSRTGEELVIDDLRDDPRFGHDMLGARLRSVLCVPINKAGRLLGVLVLENRQLVASFNLDRLRMTRFLATQAGNAIDNAKLYRAQRRSEVYWRSLVDGAPDVISLLDGDGNLKFLNQSLPGWHIGRPPTLAPQSQAAWSRAIETARSHRRRQVLEFALVADTDDDTARHFEARVAGLEIVGEPRQVMLIARDVTERKRAEHRHQELEAQVREQQRLESIGTLASGVAHEINNPVQGVMAYAELIRDAAGDPGTVTNYANEIISESHRIAEIVRNLLSFARKETGTRHELSSIEEIIVQTLLLVRTLLRKDMILVELDIDDDLPLVECHAQGIRQVVMNLVTNARDALNARWPKHQHPDKKITIAATAVARDGRDWVRVDVCDRGTGMAEDVRERIFDPFFTTKGQAQGTGLGLSISHGIVLDHGGALTVSSELGVGTTFHIALPATARH